MEEETLNRELLEAFIEEADEFLIVVDDRLLKLEENPGSKDDIDAIFRSIHSLKGTAGFFKLDLIKDLAHKMENLLDEIRMGKRTARRVNLDILFEGTTCLKGLFRDLAASGAKRDALPLEQSLLSRIDKLLSTEEGESDPAPVANPEKTPVQEVKEENRKKTLRIDESTVDKFMYFVGELIHTSEVFGYLGKKFEGQASSIEGLSEFKRAITSFEALSQELQKSLMEVRKVPLNSVIGKIPRMARDLSKSLGKDVAVRLVGEDLLLDKSLAEILEEPLVHIVRNSLDHGLEKTEDRISKNKPRSGKITIEGKMDKEVFTLLIQDDGAGIDPQKIKAVALRKGVITQEKATSMPDQEALNLIFAPGFSCAEKVTEISGRGVGMDVVLTNIKKAKGTVEVSSAVNIGTSIKIQLPLSMSVFLISTLSVQVGQNVLLIPVDQVSEIVQATKDMVYPVQNKREMISFRENVYPLVRLSHLLEGEKTKYEANKQEMFILIEEAGQKVFLAVDSVIGKQSSIIKSITKEMVDQRIFRGASVLPNGKLVLILNIEGILKTISGVPVIQAA